MSNIPAGYPQEPDTPAKLERENTETAYKRLCTPRWNFINRAQDAASLTIPAVMRQTQYTSQTALDTPWQSMGARGVNNLSAKLNTTLFPPGLSFFKLSVNPYVLARVSGSADGKAEIERNVSVIEKQVSSQVEASSLRATLYEAFQHLLITGNGVLYVREDLSARFYNLKEYVCVRDTSGNLLRLITVDRLAREMLPPEIQAKMQPEDNQAIVYTDVYRVDKSTFETSQECMGVPIPTSIDGLSMAQTPADKLPFIVMRFQQLSGESYGRGMVEDLMGDLSALEGLTQSQVEYAAAASKLIMLVNPNGITRVKDLAEVQNGGYAPGLDGDVTPLTLEKSHDMGFANQMLMELKQSLGQSFLLGQSIQRDAERVTAEEIRMLMRELEASLGGVYSLLAESLQLPLVRRLISVMEREQKIPVLPVGILEPQIITGIEGLGRGADFQNTTIATKTLGETVGPEELNVLVDTHELALRLYTGVGVDSHGLVREPDAIAGIRQQQAQQKAGEVAAGPAINAIGGLLQQQQQAG